MVYHRELEQCRTVCTGVWTAWSSLKYGIGRDHHLARNVIEAVVISIGDEGCVEAAAKYIGLNKRTQRRAVVRRQAWDGGVEGEVWAKKFRKKRRDALSQSTIDAVVNWWTDETRVSPSKKDVRRKRVGVNQFLTHVGHWLEHSHVFYFSYDLVLLKICTEGHGPSMGGLGL